MMKLRFQIWHMAVLVLFVAVAIANIQDQRTEDPRLIALACAGFVGYAALAWLGWRWAGRYREKLGATVVLVLYLVGLAALFLAASGVYVTLETYYKIHHR